MTRKKKQEQQSVEGIMERAFLFSGGFELELLFSEEQFHCEAAYSSWKIVSVQKGVVSNYCYIEIFPTKINSHSVTDLRMLRQPTHFKELERWIANGVSFGTIHHMVELNPRDTVDQNAVDGAIKNDKLLIQKRMMQKIEQIKEQ